MQRQATADIRFHAVGSARMILAVAVAHGGRSSEQLEIEQAGQRIPFVEMVDPYGSRLHEADIEAGDVTIRYAVEVDGFSPRAATDDLDILTFLRQSRYCESDALHETAHENFDGLEGQALLLAVREWTATNIRYEHGSTST